jgi:UrcA family protein
MRASQTRSTSVKTSIKLLLPLVAATVSSLAAATAPIRVTLAAPSVIVKYDAARLATKDGVKDLHGRLFIAARAVCTELDSRVLGLREVHDQCVRDAVRRSVDDVDNANLTNYFRYGTLPRVVAAN